ncbi:hypothetical protein [Rhodococcus sp. Q1]|nr:hypothetical protein [Rhodococcus sp. Q1]
MTAVVTTEPTSVIEVEADPTPMVLSVARTLRSSARNQDSAEQLANARGTVVLRDVQTPQAVTITFTETGARIAHGAITGSTVELRVDASNGFAVLGGGEDGVELSTITVALLSPSLPDWREAAVRFWDFTSSDPGMPDRLVLEDTDSGTRLTVGEGPVGYEIAGSATDLARILSGVDSLFDAVFGKKVTILGTFAQLSVMVGASWKVQFHG